jgi:Zn-dependent M16 (insulinase) family peptidase
VFAPLLTPQAFAQEGWHYELDDTGNPTYKGVVFNEMKGHVASAERLLNAATNSALYGDHVYGMVAGGDPVHIPDLTHKGLLSFHRSKYHPSNSYTVFFGNDPVDRRLELLNERFKAYEREYPDTLTPLCEPVNYPKSVRAPYPSSTGLSGKDHYTMLCWMLPEITDPHEAIELDLLMHILVGQSASPLRKALIDSGIGKSVSVRASNDRQMPIGFGLKGVDEGNVSQVEPLVLAILQGLLDNGIDQNTLESAINLYEFSRRECNTGQFPRGLSVAFDVMGWWMYDRDPFDALRFESAITHVRQRLERHEPVFENHIQKYLLDNPARVFVTLYPDDGLEERTKATEMETLAAVKAAWGPDDLAKVRDLQAELKTFQETPDPPDYIKLLPRLNVSDLDKNIKLTPTEISDVGGVKAYSHRLTTNGIAYVDFALSIRHLTPVQLSLLPLISRGLRDAGTKKSDFVTLSQRIGASTGGLHFQPVIRSLRNSLPDCVGYLFLKGKSLSENVGALFALMSEILMEPDLDRKDRYGQIVREMISGFETRARSAHSGLATTRAESKSHLEGWAGEVMGGVAQYRSLLKIARLIDTDWDFVRAQIRETIETLVAQAGSVLSITVDPDAASAVLNEASAFVAGLPYGAPKRPLAWFEPSGIVRSGLAVPSTVSGASLSLNLAKIGAQPTSAYSVIANHLRTGWIYEQIRMRGGAYGAWCGYDAVTNSFSFRSNSDPSPERTIDVCKQAASELSSHTLTMEELSPAIIGAVSDIDFHRLPDARGFAATMHMLTGDTDEARQVRRDQVLGASANDARLLAAALVAAFESGAHIAVHGPKATLESVSPQLDVEEVLTA